MQSSFDVDHWMSTSDQQSIVVAAARVGGIYANAKSPAEFIHDNLIIQTDVIEAARRYGVLFIGYSCVYPCDAHQSMSEDALLNGPLEPTNQWYAVAKIAGLKTCQAYGGNTIVVSCQCCRPTCMGRAIVLTENQVTWSLD